MYERSTNKFLEDVKYVIELDSFLAAEEKAGAIEKDGIQLP